MYAEGYEAIEYSVGYFIPGAEKNGRLPAKGAEIMPT
jgi:hypothetical protein